MHRSTFFLKLCVSQFIKCVDFNGQSPKRRQIRSESLVSKLHKKVNSIDLLYYYHSSKTVYLSLSHLGDNNKSERIISHFRRRRSSTRSPFLVSQPQPLNFRRTATTANWRIERYKIERPKMRLVVACRRNSMKSEIKNECGEWLFRTPKFTIFFLPKRTDYKNINKMKITYFFSSFHRRDCCRRSSGFLLLYLFAVLILCTFRWKS